MKNQPEKVYLNIGANGECEDFKELDSSQVSWSGHRIFEDDLEYIQVTDYDKLKEAFEECYNDIVSKMNFAQRASDENNLEMFETHLSSKLQGIQMCENEVYKALRKAGLAINEKGE